MRELEVAPTAAGDEQLESLSVTGRAPEQHGIDGPRPDDAHLDAPRWLRLAAFVAAGAVLAFGASGLLLAVLGVYRPAIAYSLGFVVWLALIALVRPHVRRAGASSRQVHVAAVVGVLAILTITGWHTAHTSQHVLINRDGGAYTNEGRWIRAARLARDPASTSVRSRPRTGWPMTRTPCMRCRTTASSSSSRTCCPSFLQRRMPWAGMPRCSGSPSCCRVLRSSRSSCSPGDCSADHGSPSRQRSGLRS